MRSLTWPRDTEEKEADSPEARATKERAIGSMNDELRNKLGQFSNAAAALAECLATQDDPPTVDPSLAPRDCMTRKQLADHLQVTEQAIANWQNRANHPSPCGYAGDKPRYFLSDVNTGP